jgi:hypothetical protein
MDNGQPSRPLDRLAALDPTGAVGRRLVGFARRVPGVSAGEREVQRLERALFRELARRIDDAAPPAELPRGAAHTRTAGAPERPASPPELMETLLRRSIAQTPNDGERTLIEMLVRELVPDEARILSALADGSAYALIDIVGRGGSDRGQTLLANVSSVGRAAGVVLPERTPTYVAHMLGLDLARRGGELESLREDYEILLTEPAVMKARGGHGGLRAARVVKGSLRISELGETLWKATTE